MFSALPEAERDAITVIAFIGTFFIALGIGRFLKRRAGVSLGLLFRLFCLILAFYAAIVVYGVHAPWRHHVGAAAILLSTALVVALINRYVWDFYFEKKRQTPIPHFLREVVGGIVFLIVLLFVLSYGYHAETQLKGLLAGWTRLLVGFLPFLLILYFLFRWQLKSPAAKLLREERERHMQHMQKMEELAERIAK